MMYLCMRVCIYHFAYPAKIPQTISAIIAIIFTATVSTIVLGVVVMHIL